MKSIILLQIFSLLVVLILLYIIIENMMKYYIDYSMGNTKNTIQVAL